MHVSFNLAIAFGGRCKAFANALLTLWLKLFLSFTPRSTLAQAGGKRARERESVCVCVYMCICTFICAQAVAASSKGSHG